MTESGLDLMNRYRPALTHAARALDELAKLREWARHEPTAAKLDRAAAAELRALLACLPPEPLERPVHMGGMFQ